MPYTHWSSPHLYSCPVNEIVPLWLQACAGHAIKNAEVGMYAVPSMCAHSYHVIKHKATGHLRQPGQKPELHA